MKDLEKSDQYLTYEIKLGRSYYAQSAQIITWLQVHVGAGNYYDQYHTGLIVYADPDQAMWHWEQNFGHTWIKFKREEDLVQFKLTWC